MKLFTEQTEACHRRFWLTCLHTHHKYDSYILEQIVVHAPDILPHSKWSQTYWKFCLLCESVSHYTWGKPWLRVPTLLLRNNSRNFSGLSRTPKTFYQDALDCTCTTKPIVCSIIHGRHAWPSALYTKMSFIWWWRWCLRPLLRQHRPWIPQASTALPHGPKSHVRYI